MYTSDTNYNRNPNRIFNSILKGKYNAAPVSVPGRRFSVFYFH